MGDGISAVCGVGAEVFDGYEFEGAEVGGFEDDGWGVAGVEGLGPAADAEAPGVAGFQAGEVEFGAWGGEVVALGACEIEEVGGHDGADGVESVIFRAGAAEAIAIEAGGRVGAAGLEW